MNRALHDLSLTMVGAGVAPLQHKFVSTVLRLSSLSSLARRHTKHHKSLSELHSKTHFPTGVTRLPCLSDQYKGHLTPHTFSGVFTHCNTRYTTGVELHFTKHGINIETDQLHSILSGVGKKLWKQREFPSSGYAPHPKSIDFKNSHLLTEFVTAVIPHIR